MAPEVLTRRQYGKMCDVWGAGVMLHVLLSGRLPFNGSGRRLQEAIARGRVPVRFRGERRPWNIQESLSRKNIRKVFRECEILILRLCETSSSLILLFLNQFRPHFRGRRDKSFGVLLFLASSSAIPSHVTSKQAISATTMIFMEKLRPRFPLNGIRTARLHKLGNRNLSRGSRWYSTCWLLQSTVLFISRKKRFLLNINEIRERDWIKELTAEI